MPRREVLGFWFDAADGKFYPTAGDESPSPPAVSEYTFNDLWNISKTPFFKDQPLNPFYTPTYETALKVFDWAQRVVDGHAMIRLVQEPIKSSPFAHWSHNEWSIVAQRTDFEGESDHLSVGLIASSLIRNGERWPARSLEAELRQQGAWA